MVNITASVFAPTSPQIYQRNRSGEPRRAVHAFIRLKLTTANADSLEGVAQQEADLAAGVALLAFALVALGPVELRLDLSDAGHLLLLLVEVGAGELVSHGFGPKQTQTLRG